MVSENITVQVTDVDLPNRIVHVKDKTGGSFQITFRATGAFLQVPAVGEYWTATRVGFEWHLGSRINSPSDVEEVPGYTQGDIRIRTDGDIHLNPGGDVLVNGDPIGSGGVSDHGSLTGLGDDDHTQYHNNARGDARYWQLTTDLATQAELNAVDAAKLDISTAASTYQPLDSDLTTIAGLTATTDNFIQAKAGAWASRTVAQVVADLVTGGLLASSTAASTYQPLDSDLTAIAGLSPTDDDVVQRKAGAWVNRTMAQLAADLVSPLSSSLQPIDSDLTAIASLSPSNDDVVQRKGGVWTNRTIAQLGSDPATTYQPLDSDLTTIAGLTATTDNFIQAKAGAWASRTVAQVVTDLIAGGLLSSSTAASTYQPLDSDLTSIAGLTPTNDDIVQRKAGAWTNRTMTQLATDLVSPLSSSFQALDSDLTTIAGLTATTDNFIQSKAGAWASRTVAQVVTDLITGGLLSSATAASTYQPLDSDLTSIAGLSASNDDVIQRKSGAWANRTLAQLGADLSPIVPRFKVGAFTWNTGTGTGQSVTGVGFTPRLIIFFTTGYAASSTALTFGMGVDNGTNRYGVAVRATSAGQYRSKSASSSMYLLESNSTTPGVTGYVNSFDADGFTLNRVTHTGDSQPEFYYLAIG